jgi:hypothetical protein
VTPTPTAVACAISLPTTLYEGMYGRVVPGGVANRIRSTPSLNGVQVGDLPPGERFVVLDGPECGDGFAWVQVNYQGTIGWTATGDDSVYWLEPLPGRAAFEPNVCVIEALGTINLREEPSTGSALAGQLPDNQMLVVEAQTQGTDGFTWWLLENDAWVRDDIVATSGNCGAVPEAQ